MTPYYLIYLLVSAGLPICFLNDVAVRKIAQRIYFAGIIAVLAVFAGVRSPGVDADSYNYIFWFDSVSTGSATQMQWIRDPPFALISYIVSGMGLHYPVVATIYAFLGLLTTIIFVEISSNPRWATLFFYLFFCQYFLVGEMTLIRSAVAIPLMAISIYLASERRHCRALFVYILALLFHFSVIAALPFLLLLLAGVQFRSRVWIYFLIAFGVIVANLMIPLVSYLSTIYRISEFMIGERPENPLPTLSWYLLAHLLTISVSVLLMWKRLTIHMRITTLLACLGICLFQIFIGNPGLAPRLIYLFDLYWLLIMVVILERLKGDKRFVYVAFLIAGGLALFIKSLQYIKPYSTVFD